MFLVFRSLPDLCKKTHRTISHILASDFSYCNLITLVVTWLGGPCYPSWLFYWQGGAWYLKTHLKTHLSVANADWYILRQKITLFLRKRRACWRNLNISIQLVKNHAIVVICWWGCITTSPTLSFPRAGLKTLKTGFEWAQHIHFRVRWLCHVFLYF